MAEGGGRQIVRVEREDPPVFSCAACGWVPTPWTPEAPRALIFAVVEHWLAAHWDRCGPAAFDVKRHVAELAYADGQMWARCRCGWTGTAYQVRVIGREAAVRAAEREAVAHERQERS